MRRTIKNLSAKKSSGADGISNDLLKILANSIAEPLCIVINESMSTGKISRIDEVSRGCTIVQRQSTGYRDELSSYFPAYNNVESHGKGNIH